MFKTNNEDAQFDTETSMDKANDEHLQNRASRNDEALSDTDTHMVEALDEQAKDKHSELSSGEEDDHPNLPSATTIFSNQILSLKDELLHFLSARSCCFKGVYKCTTRLVYVYKCVSIKCSAFSGTPR